MESDVQADWMPMQVIRAVTPTHAFPEEVQTDILKILLNIVCSTRWGQNSLVIEKIIDVCIDAFANASQGSVKTVAKATVYQIVSSFCQRVKDGHEEAEIGRRCLVDEETSAVRDWASVVAVLNSFCEKLSCAQNSSNQNAYVPLLLEGVLAVVSNVPQTVQSSEHFVNLIWFVEKCIPLKMIKVF